MLLAGKIAKAVILCFGSTTLAVIESWRWTSAIFVVASDAGLQEMELTMATQLSRHLIRHSASGEKREYKDTDEYPNVSVDR